MSDSAAAVDGVRITGEVNDLYDSILTRDALAFVAGLQRVFGARRTALLADRVERQTEIDAGKLPDFLPETAAVRNDASWRVGAIPKDLQMRRVEITGPVERKMMINALNSEANIFMADCEDANSPTWDNIVMGQVNLRDAVNRSIEFTNPNGKKYRLKEETATLLVRPRGWHLPEKHVEVDGQPVSASLFDFGLYFFHNARTLLANGSGPYFYIPKLESHREARLWNDVFNHAQDELGIARGTIKVTVLVETILAAFEMEEILYELRDHIAGLNAGRWDYIFSVIKKFRNQPGFILPDRAQINMAVPFMHSYAEQLVKVCHKRGAHAIGGMAAFIPNRRDPEVTENALKKVTEDKRNEAEAGFDGTWVAHPDLVPVARAEFDRVIGDRPHQKERLREDVAVTAADLMNFDIDGGRITESGVRLNINVGLQYISSWLNGVGAAGIYNLMEDAATAEISRAQLWQWLSNSLATLEDGLPFTPELYRKLMPEELDKIRALWGEEQFKAGRFEETCEIFDQLVLSPEFVDFLTLIAYEKL